MGSVQCRRNLRRCKDLLGLSLGLDVAPGWSKAFGDLLDLALSFLRLGETTSMSSGWFCVSWRRQGPHI
eukprot:g20832.t1